MFLSSISCLRPNKMAKELKEKIKLRCASVENVLDMFFFQSSNLSSNSFQNIHTFCSVINFLNSFILWTGRRICRISTTMLKARQELSLPTVIDLHFKVVSPYRRTVSKFLYNNQINAPALIGQSAMGYCAGKPMEKSRVF